MQQQQLGADGQPISPNFIVNVSQYPEPEAPREAVASETDGRHWDVLRRRSSGVVAHGARAAAGDNGGWCAQRAMA